MRNFFKDCVFIHDFAEAGLKGLISEVPKEIFLTLVRLFYVNLNFIDGVLIFKVKKHQIPLTFEEFSDIYNLTYIDFNYDDSEKCNKYKTIQDFIPFLEKQNIIIPSPFTIGIICQNIRLIHYMVNHVLFPR